MTDARSHFLSDLYIRHNARRLEHLASLHLDLRHKSVLELGAGIGDHSSFYLDRGCRVTAVEPRPENVAVLRERQRDTPDAWDPDRLRVIQAEVEQLDDIDDLGVFDVVHCYGLLYHLTRPADAIRMAAARCRGLFLLETKVRLPHHPSSLVEDRANLTNAVGGAATILTRDELLAHVAGQLPHVYVPDVPVAHEQFPRDWDRLSPTQWPLRMVVVASRAPVENPLLRDYRP